MTTQIESLFTEGYFIDRPPLFNESNYVYWKARMKIFIQAHYLIYGEL